MTHAGHWEAEHGFQDDIYELPMLSGVRQDQNTALLWLPTVDGDQHPGENMGVQCFGVAQTFSAVLNTSSVNQRVTEWPGELGFSAVVAVQPKSGKNATWTYSEQLRKFYANINVPCPVKFVTDRPPPLGSFVCMVAVFRESESRRENVLPCPVHRRPLGPYEGQWLQCDHPAAEYCLDSANGGRHCVVVDAARLSETFGLKFGCRNSCAGGLNRRATEVVFLLQSPEGRDLARSVVQVKVCACPGRDRKHDERSLGHARSAAQVARVGAPSTSRHRDLDGTEASSSDSGTEGRCGAKVLRVKGRDVYQLLSPVHKSLEIAHAARAKKRASTRHRPSSESDE